jgi:polar amino acid transport system permease protein
MNLDYSWLGDGLFQALLLKGVGTTVLMSLLGIVLMLAIGVAGAFCLHFKIPVMQTLVTVLVELLRNTPPLVQLFFLYFMLSEIGLQFVAPGTGRSVPLFSGFVCVVLSLGLYNGAIAVEIVRSGLYGVPSQTVEGARSLGYTRFQVFRHIELPIGLRLATSAMTNNVVSLIKTSSQASLVAVADIMFAATRISVETFRNLEVMLLIWVLYVALASLAVFVMHRIASAFRMPGYGVRAS